MNWIKVIRNAAVVTLIAFSISSVLMLFLNSRVNWLQQSTTAVFFFIAAGNEKYPFICPNCAVYLNWHLC